MTVVPPSSDNFSKYYQDYLKQIAPTKAAGAPVDFPQRTGQGGEDLGFLGRTLDILSRPLRIVSNPVMKALEIPEKNAEIAAREAAGEDVSALEKFAPVGDVLAAPFTGFFSDNPENKPYWSDIIEKEMDVRNRNNPNYVDTENNVDPVAKGVLGFVADVALDPLTWVPATWFAKGAQLATKGAKAATGAVKGGTAAAKEARAAGKTTSEFIQDTMVGAKEGAIRTGEDLVNSVDGTAQASKKASDFIKEAADSGEVPSKALSGALRSVIDSKKIMRGKRPLNQVNQMRKLIDEWTAPLAPKLPVPGKLLSEDEWVTAMDDIADRGVLNTVELAVGEIGGIKFDGTLQDLVNQAKILNETNPAKYEKWLSDNLEEVVRNIEPYYDQYVKNFEANPAVNIIGEVPEAPLSGAAAAVTRLAEMADSQMAQAREVFNSAGNDLFGALKGLDEAGFVKFLDDIKPILEKNGVVETMSDVRGGTLQAKTLRTLGVSVPEFRAKQAAMAEKIANLINYGTPPPVDEAVTKLLEDQGYVTYLREALKAFDTGYFKPSEMVDDVIKATQNAAKLMFTKNFDKKYLDKNYEFILENGELKIRKTDIKKGSGSARIENTYGTYTQNDFFVALSDQMVKLLSGKYSRDALGNKIYDIIPEYFYTNAKGQKVAYEGFGKASAMHRVVIQSMRVFEDYVSAKGLAITIDETVSKGVRAVYPIRFTDIYEVIDRNIIDPRWLRLVMFNQDATAMSFPLLGDAVISMMRGGGFEEVKAVLMRGTNRWNNQPNGNWLASGKSGDFGFQPGAKKPENLPEGITSRPKTENGKTIGHYLVWDPEVAATRLAEALWAGRKDIDDIINIRQLQYKAQEIVDFNTIAPSIAQNLLRMFSDPAQEAAALVSVNNMGKMVKDFVRAVEVGEPGAAYTANAVYIAVPASVRRSAKAAEDIAKARKTGNPADVHAARQRAAKGDKETVKEMNEKAAKAADDIKNDPNASPEDRQLAEDVLNRSYDETLVDGEDVYETMNVGIFGRIADALSATYGLDAVNHLRAFQLFKAPARAMQNWAHKIEGRLSRLSPRRNPEFNGTIDGKTTILTAALRNIQQGVKAADEVNPIVRKAQELLERETVLLFGSGNKLLRSITETGFGRSGAALEPIAKAFETFKVLGDKTPPGGVFFDIDKALRVANDEGIDVVTAALRQWKDWGDIEDPIRFIAQANAAMMSVATKANFVDNFIVDMGRKGLFVSTAAEAKAKGFVKVSSDSLNYMRQYVPENMYLDPEVAAIFRRMDDIFSTSRTLDSKFGQWWTKNMDPFMQTWKYTVTVIRLGHHIRNEIGGQSMRWIALGNSGYAWAERMAYRLLGKENKYRGVDILEGLKQMGLPVVQGGENIIDFGKLGKLSEKEIWQDFQTFLQATGKRAEDLFDEGGQTAAKKVSDILGAVGTAGLGTRGGVVEELALGVSEFVENKARFAHYLQVLKQASNGKPVARSVTNVVKPKTIEEARQFAIESALKYHPDPLMLTAFEARYGRRIMPFYSWYKQALLALMQSAILNPARTITTIPKASYNLAISMGLDPSSMYNPFPEDQLFPSFLTEEMTGPQFQIDGKYVAVNPGFANLDVFNQTFTDPLEGVVQMTNPFVRVPLELLAGSRLGSQAPITDISDYIDSSIPGINYISNVSGRSVTGGFEEQRGVARGNKTAFDQWLSAINWATGFGVRNYSRENYINYAEIEQRNKAAEEARNR